MADCYFCGTAIVADRIYRSSACPSCGKELKICFHCDFYQPGSHWDCRETIAEAVRDKDKANFCDFFRLKKESQPKKMDSPEKQNDAFNNLFSD